jgi:hypothetical protein
MHRILETNYEHIHYNHHHQGASTIIHAIQQNKMTENVMIKKR